MTISIIRKFTVLLALSVLPLLVINCSKKDKDEPSGPTTSIEGSWKITAVYTKSGNSAEVDQYPLIVQSLSCFPNIVMTFNASGLISASVPEACQAAVNGFVGDLNGSTYEVKSDQLIIKDSKGTTQTMIISFSNNQMSWSDASGSGGSSSSFRLVFTKQ